MMDDLNGRSRENKRRQPSNSGDSRRETVTKRGRGRVVGKRWWSRGWKRVDTFQEGSVDAVAEPVSGCYGTERRARALRPIADENRGNMTEKYL